MGMGSYRRGPAPSATAQTAQAPHEPRTGLGLRSKLHAQVKRGSLPRVVSKLMMVAIIVAGLAYEMLNLISEQAPPTAIWVVLLVPWGAVIIWDHFLRVKLLGSAMYLILVLFFLMFITLRAPTTLVSLVRDLADEQGGDQFWVAVVAFVLFARVLLPLLWNVTASRATSATEVWPIAFMMEVIMEMLFRLLMLQLQALRMAQIILMLLHPLCAILLNSARLSRPPRSMMGDAAAVATFMTDRKLRAQAGLFANLLATGMFCIAILGDTVLPYGADGMTWQVSLTGEHLLAQVIACFFGIAAYALAIVLMHGMAVDLLGGDEEAARGALASHKLLSAHWDSWAGTLVSILGFIVLRVLYDGAQLRHVYYPAAQHIIES